MARDDLGAFRGVDAHGVFAAVQRLAGVVPDDTSAPIFVQTGAADLAQMQAELARLQQHGPATLLWVTPSAGPAPIGSVDVVAPGLLRGHIDRLAAVPDLSLAAWREICRGARLLRLIEAPPGTLRPPQRPLPAANLLPGARHFEGAWWRRDAVSRSAPDAAMPPPIPDATVMTHRLHRDTDWPTAAIFGHHVPDGLVGGTDHVASLHVRLPPDFAGSLVGMVLDGFSSSHTVNADLSRLWAWQRICVRARIPVGRSEANPSLCLIGPSGSVVHTACWKLEGGVEPTAF